MAGELTITQAAVFRDRRRVAVLRYSGACIVVVEAGILPRRLGRIWPAGYMRGERDSAGLNDAWTAKHPMVHTPSDTLIAVSLPLAECIAVILEGAAS
jgi:hypothetical protein